MRQYMFHILLCVALAILYTSCDNRPEGVLSKGDMKRVLYDYHKVQGMMSNVQGDNQWTEQQYLDAVFEKHGITQAIFDSSLVWYNAHADVLKDIYTDLKQTITEENEALQLKTGNTEMAAIITNNNDTTNIWTGPKVIVLRNRNLQNLEDFTIKADTSFRPHDHILLYANVNLKHEGGYSGEYGLTMAIAIRNKEGKVFSKVEQITNSSTRQLEISQESSSDISSVYGYFYYKGKSEGRNLCLIDNIALVRMHSPQDSISNPVAPVDSVPQDTANHDTIVPAHKKSPRLSPQELLEKQQPKEHIKIKSAPDVRTPNSIGPRRRRTNQKR